MPRTTKWLYLGLILAIGLGPGQAQDTAASSPTFLLFKYQHPVGEEIDKCDRSAGEIRCIAHFELRFTGSSVPLDAKLETDAAFHPRSYWVKGRNSTRSDLDLAVKINGHQAEIVEDGKPRVAAVPDHAFTLVQNAPLLTQELLLAYWKKNGRPQQIELLPVGKVQIRLRGTDHLRIADHDEILERYTLHGITWGEETLWLNDQQQIAAVIGTDAEEDRFEALRPQYQPMMKQLVKQAAADAVASLESQTKKLRPLASGVLAFTHATILDPRGSAPLRDATVVVKDGKITALGKVATIPTGATILSARGKFILPGLWDTHAHFEQWEWALAYLASGTTSVRDVGNEIEFLVPIRDSMNAGRSFGPYMYAAGLIDSDPGSLTSEHAEDAAQARSIIGRYHDLGYEEIKIYQSLRPDLVPVVTAEAHQLKMQVTGHIPTGIDALQGVGDGMDQINHIGFAGRVMRPRGSTDLRPDSPEAQKAIRFFLDHHTVIEPTLARSEFNLHRRRQLFSEIEPSVSLLPPELAVILNNAGVPAENEARAASSLQLSLKTTRILHDAGVPILAGTDQVVPGHSLARELELLVEAGLTPLEAIRCATITPAQVLGVSAQVGTIEVGKRADLVILDADPLEDIRNIRRVHWTVSRGRVFVPEKLWPAIDFRAPSLHGPRN